MAQIVTSYSSPRSIQKDEKLWFEDGNIVLFAGDFQFRVYGGILAKLSPVFRDMFSVPQPLNESLHNTPYPVVHLTDSPHDLRQILRIYMPNAKSK